MMGILMASTLCPLAEAAPFVAAEEEQREREQHDAPSDEARPRPPFQRAALYGPDEELACLAGGGEGGGDIEPVGEDDRGQEQPAQEREAEHRDLNHDEGGLERERVSDRGTHEHE